MPAYRTARPSRLPGKLRCVLAAATALAACAPTLAAGQSVEPLLDRIGEYVERYYARTDSIVADEHVRVQRLERDLSLIGFARRLVYELRVEWKPDAGPEEDPATVTRRLMQVNDRPASPDAQRECLDLQTVSPAPLAFLLPGRRDTFRFREAGTGNVGGRPAAIIEYEAVTPEPPEAVWNDMCVSVDLPGRTRGRVWADARTGEVLKLEEGITGMVEIDVPVELQRRGAARRLTIERVDMSIEYRHVTFTDPAETVLLPWEVRTMTAVRNGGSPRVLTTQTFDNYRRFVTGSRLVR